MTDSETDQTDEEEMGEEMEEENEEGDEHEVEQVEGNNTKCNTKRSWIWKHFKFDDSVKKARCSYCKNLISCNKGSITGLSNHLKSKYSLTKDQGKGQLTIPEVINNNSKAIVYSKEIFRKFLIEWIVKNDLPFTCVESKDFRNMNMSKKISFTIDGWTSSNNIFFLSITAHLVTNEWELKSFLLDFIKLDSLHSGDNIKDAFLKSLRSYNIESKILSVTTDNASNNVTFLQIVEDELSKKFIDFDSKDKHVRCLAHIMNLAAQQALSTLKVTEDNEPSNENILYISNSDPSLRTLTINEEEWARLGEIELLLKCFAKATKQICGETYPTISYVIPIFNILLNKLEDFRDTPGRFENGKETAINAINKLKDYYNKTDTTLYSALLILDPRLKLEYMKDNEWERSGLIKQRITYKLKIFNSFDLNHIRHEEEYPHLAIMAKDFLGVPATSAPSERIFSSAADVITYDRASLAPEMVHSVMCLKHWYLSGLLD
ncbi:unnamed protein product [Rhizophagus irregularis]|nr:unnamed protein product [Rhizophagus irregularis]